MKVGEVLSVSRILLIFLWSKACTQELSLTGFFGSRNSLTLVCTHSPAIPASTIRLTINGERDIGIFGFNTNPRNVDNRVEVISTAFTASNNILVALCHSQMVTSNSYIITRDNIDPNSIPIIFNATSLNLVVPDQLNITCIANSNEVNPVNIVLRINGDVETDNIIINNLDGSKSFSIASSLSLDNVVAQCTNGILGSSPGIINVRERECDDCTNEYFCNGTSFCYAPQTLCNSALVSMCGDPCPQQQLDGNTCQRCKPQCDTSEYFCVSTSSCLPYATLCDGTDSCDEGCQTQFSSDENDEFCSSCFKEDECENTEYFCRTTQTCLPYSTLCNGSVECQLTCFDTAAGLRTDEGEICGTDCEDNEINCVFSDGMTPQCVAPSTTQICGNTLFHCENVCRGRGTFSGSKITRVVVPVVIIIIIIIIIVVAVIFLVWYFKIRRKQNSKIRRKQNSKITKQEPYQMPKEDEHELYVQLDDIDASLKRNDVMTPLGDQLGKGQFGLLNKGVMQSDGKEMEVAVQTLENGEDKVNFLKKAVVMAQFKDPHVITAYGVITQGEPMLLVLELCTLGDLRRHLLKREFGVGQMTINGHTLLRFSHQVASGMAYLSSKGFVHKDLAARNVLVSSEWNCKIAGFSFHWNEKVLNAQEIKVKWTAIEAWNEEYSSASDVWSYGVLVYEIWSVGCEPFGDTTDNEVIQKVKSGYRLPPPPGCPRLLYKIMISCWNPQAVERISFPEISQKLRCPDSRVLGSEDKKFHLKATQLGAGLQYGEELYKDLQNKYRTRSK